MSADTAQLMPMAEEATRLIKALAHPERLMICCQLKFGEMSVGQIETLLDITQPRLSRELGKLRQDDILGTRRESRVIYYHLKDDRVRAIVETLCEVMLGEQAAAEMNRKAGVGL